MQDNEANTAFDKDDGVLIISATDNTSGSWVLDFGASYHATSYT